MLRFLAAALTASALWLLAAGSAPAGQRLARCGGLGQEACKIFEAIPSCDPFLVEVVEGCGFLCFVGICRDNGCGGKDERACLPFLDHGWPDACISGLANAAGACRVLDGEGFPDFCGHEGQRACTLDVQVSLGIPSCASHHFEEGFPFGTCRALDADGFPVGCGDGGERACTLDLQLQIGIPSCKPRHFEAGFPFSGTCERLDDRGFPVYCGDEAEPACTLDLQLQLGIGPCKAGTELVGDLEGMCLAPIGFTAIPVRTRVEQAPGRRTVFVVHGAGSGAFGPAERVVAELTAAGHRVYAVDYHSDEEGPAQPFLVHEIVNGESVEVYRSPSWRFRGESLTIPTVARALAEAIRAVDVDTDVALVAHSMGGLVSRQLVYAHYDELLDAGRRVSEVITLGTPHQGALLDPLGPAFHDLQGAFSCSQATRLLAAGTVARVAVVLPFGLVALAFAEITDPGRLAALAGLATSPAARRFLWQNCQMERWQIALRDAPGAFVDDRDFPQIHWLAIAGTGHDVVPLDSPPLTGDGIVPASSALSIRADAKARFVAGHSDLYADAQVVERVKREIGLEAPACDDGRDNDGDQAEDLADRGCPAAGWVLEDPPCDDGRDNDGDGRVDFDDPTCASAALPLLEDRLLCGLGFEVAGLLPLWAMLRRRLGRREAR